MRRVLLLIACLAFVPAAAGGDRDSGLAGKRLLPREIAEAMRPYWSNYELTKGVATALSESAGYVGAWHDNLGPGDVAVLSRDCGELQINIPGAAIGSPLENALRSESLDPASYGPVLANNIWAADSLYAQPWTRGGQPDVRRWQPWVGYTSGWATFPAFWIWHQENGLPVGPWIPTGRYLERAIAGQMNRRVLLTKDWTAQQALVYARRYAAHFGVDAALAYVTDGGFIGFRVPAKPVSPPADGVGPRPATNDGA